MILTFYPHLTVPEKTLPKALNLPLSYPGTILEMYIINGPFGSHFFMAFAHSSSIGPVYKASVL
jgi:hypothetical protein